APVSNPKSEPGACQTTCAPPKKQVRASVSSTSPEKVAMLTPATGPNSDDCAAASSAEANVAAMTASAYSLRIVTSFSDPHGVVVRGYGHTLTSAAPFGACRRAVATSDPMPGYPAPEARPRYTSGRIPPWPSRWR